MAAAIKSLMIFEVIHAGEDLVTGEVGEIFEMYYRGIEQGPEILTFYQAAFVASIFSIVLIYGTAFITIMIFSLRFYGLSQWYENIKDNFVLFIFPLVTNFSFYQKMEVKEPTDVTVECQNYTEKISIFQYSKKISRTLSLPELAILGRAMEQPHQGILKKRKGNPHTKNIVPTESRKRNPCFCRTQSNILYGIFLFNYLFILAIDLGIQIKRKESVSEITKTTFVLVVCNLFLWLDFLSENRNN